MTDKIKRYDTPNCADIEDGGSDPMQEREGGDFVLHSDLMIIAEQRDVANAAAEAALRTMGKVHEMMTMVDVPGMVLEAPGPADNLIQRAAWLVKEYAALKLCVEAQEDFGANMASPDYDELRDAVKAMFVEIVGEDGPHSYRDDGNAPGHGHTIPGVWDDDNRKEIAGKPCKWCAAWSRMRGLVK